MQALEPKVVAERAAHEASESTLTDGDDAETPAALEANKAPPRTSRRKAPTALMIGRGALVLGGIAMILAAKQQHAMAYDMRDTVGVRQSQAFADVGAGLAIAGVVAGAAGFVWHIEADDDHVAVSASTTF